MLIPSGPFILVDPTVGRRSRGAIFISSYNFNDGVNANVAYFYTQNLRSNIHYYGSFLKIAIEKNCSTVINNWKLWLVFLQMKMCYHFSTSNKELRSEGMAMESRAVWIAFDRPPRDSISRTQCQCRSPM